jgi:glyceraldehyde-3-phosphate dehydrogenase (NADP+)
MEEFAAEITKERCEIINLLMWEICKTCEDATKEFDRTIEYILDTCDEYRKLLEEDSKIETFK